MAVAVRGVELPRGEQGEDHGDHADDDDQPLEDRRGHVEPVVDVDRHGEARRLRCLDLRAVEIGEHSGDLRLLGVRIGHGRSDAHNLREHRRSVRPDVDAAALREVGTRRRDQLHTANGDRHTRLGSRDQQCVLTKSFGLRRHGRHDRLGRVGVDLAQHSARNAHVE
jgi:hypothetical protein